MRRCGATWRKPVEEITDRQKRVRANHPDCRPRGPKRCAKCGKRPPDTLFRPGLIVAHKDGDESNGRRSNLEWQCYPCNAKEVHRLKKLGKGVRTRQYNPRRRRKNQGAKTLGEYVDAAVKHTRGAIDEGGRVIHETPAAKRRSYAREIWRRRRASGRVSSRNGESMRRKNSRRRNPKRSGGYLVVRGRNRVALAKSPSKAKAREFAAKLRSHFPGAGIRVVRAR